MAETAPRFAGVPLLDRESESGEKRREVLFPLNERCCMRGPNGSGGRRCIVLLRDDGDGDAEKLSWDDLSNADGDGDGKVGGGSKGEIGGLSETTGKRERFRTSVSRLLRTAEGVVGGSKASSITDGLKKLKFPVGRNPAARPCLVFDVMEADLVKFSRANSSGDVPAIMSGEKTGVSGKVCIRLAVGTSAPNLFSRGDISMSSSATSYRELFRGVMSIGLGAVPCLF